MGVINAFQSILILFLYTFVVVIIPSLILGKRFANRRFVHRFMIYLTVGNIYIINIVWLYQGSSSLQCHTGISERMDIVITARWFE